MNRRILTAAMATCLSVFTAQAVWAAPVGGWPHSATEKVKKISFQIRNDSKTPLTISMGAQDPITVQPGRTVSLKLEEGTMLTAVNGTGHVAPGAVLATVTTSLQGNTLAVS